MTISAQFLNGSDIDTAIIVTEPEQDGMYATHTGLLRRFTFNGDGTVSLTLEPTWGITTVTVSVESDVFSASRVSALDSLLGAE